MNQMQWLWTWGGECFGYREGDELRTYDGRHVGCFQGAEVYARDGRYLGEIMREDRLVASHAKASWRQAAFGAQGNRGAYARFSNYAGNALAAGHADFPHPDTLQ
jgi:hypothetical protein